MWPLKKFTPPAKSGHLSIFLWHLIVCNPLKDLTGFELVLMQYFKKFGVKLSVGKLI